MRYLLVILALLSDAQLLIRDVDTIKELTDILVSHQHRLIDLSSYILSKMSSLTRSGHSFDIVSLKNDFILLSLRLGHSHSFEHVDMTHSLLSKEVTHLHLLSLLVDSNIDGEVGIHETHLVAVSVSHTSDHVADVSADRAYDSNVLVESEPEVNNHFISLLLDIDELMAEITTKGSTRSLHHNTSVLDVHLH